MYLTFFPLGKKKKNEKKYIKSRFALERTEQVPTIKLYPLAKANL